MAHTVKLEIADLFEELNDAASEVVNGGLVGLKDNSKVDVNIIQLNAVFEVDLETLDLEGL